MSNYFCLLNFHYLIKHILCVFVFMCMYACVCVYVYVCVCVCIALHSITLCLRGVLSHNQKTITQPAYIPLSCAPGQEKTGGSYHYKASRSTVNVWDSDLIEMLCKDANFLKEKTYIHISNICQKRNALKAKKFSNNMGICHVAQPQLCRSVSMYSTIEKIHLQNSDKYL